MPSASLITWTILFLIAAAQGVFIALVLLFNKRGRKKANFLLASMMLLFSFTLVHYVAYWTNYQFVYTQFMVSIAAIPFLVGPMLLMYLRQVAARTKFSKADLLHFLPFAINIGILLPFYLLSGPEKLALIKAGELDASWTSIIPWVQIAHLFAYSGWMFWRQRELVVAEQVKKWTQTLNYLFAGFAISYASYWILVRAPAW
jgi:hypothetical protein